MSDYGLPTNTNFTPDPKNVIVSESVGENEEGNRHVQVYFDKKLVRFCTEMNVFIAQKLKFKSKRSPMIYFINDKIKYSKRFSDRPIPF